MPRPQRDPATVVAFVGIPGLGKSAICEQLVQQAKDKTLVYTDSAASGDGGQKRKGKEVNAQHFMSDMVATKQRKRYWDDVASKTATEGKNATVVLADKNLIDNPRGAHRKAFCLVLSGGTHSS